jgi:hypothetical protein
MQFSTELIDQYINYMKRKHAVVISREEAQQDLMLLAQFHDSVLRGRVTADASGAVTDRREV